MNNIFDKHALFKKITRYKLKFETKSGITTALQKYIYLKFSFFKNQVKKKDLPQKNDIHNNYKIYRNLISTLMKRRKQNYFTKSFE